MEQASSRPDASAQSRRAFHRRPLCLAAVGWLLGTAGIRLLAPPHCYFAAAALLLPGIAAAWLRRRGLVLLLCCMAAAIVSAGLRYPPGGDFPLTGSVLAPPETALGGRLLILREQIAERIGQLFRENAGVARGMLLGDKGGIAQSTLADFQNVGVMHLLAISGLHVSVLAGALSLVLRRGAWTRFALVALFLAVYAALTAFSPSVVRASVMLLCGMLAFPLRRRPDTPSALSLAFILILLFNPHALFYAGFQLSFGAVYGLMLLTPAFERPLRRLGPAASGLIAGSLAVTVATVPAMALTFGRVQLMSIVTNLFVLPLVPLFLVPAFLGVTLSFLWLPLGNAVAAVARVALDVLVSFAAAGGALDVAVPAPSAPAYLLYLLALAFLSPLCLLERNRRFRLWVCCMGAAVAMWPM